MKIKFIGTGAADFDWSQYGEPGVMGSVSTLIDDHILIDCGPTVPAALERYGADPDRITDILITHNHKDHYLETSLEKIVRNRNICLHASEQICRAAEKLCKVHPLHWGENFQIGVYNILPMESNHAVVDPREETFHYLFQGEGKNLLYALDTAWLSSRAYALLGKTYLHGAIWDATMSEPGDWRIFDHSDGFLFNLQRKALIKHGNMDSETKIWFDHRARTLWPESLEEQEKIARRENVLLAIEGNTVIL